MMNPDIKGVEYQRGTFFGWQVRAYVMDRDHGRCVYCRRSNVRLQLDHVRPRAHGSDRVDNLVACCRDCNVANSNRIIEEFLAHKPELLDSIPKRLQRSDLTHAAPVNAALPAIVRDLWKLGLPISSTDAASVSWDRQQLNVPKTHCYDAALTGPGLQWRQEPVRQGTGDQTKQRTPAVRRPTWTAMAHQSAGPSGNNRGSPGTSGAATRPPVIPTESRDTGRSSLGPATPSDLRASTGP